MTATEGVELADALRELMAEVRRTLDGRPLSVEAKRELVRRAAASFKALATAWGDLAAHPRLEQSPGEVRAIADDARKLLSALNSPLGQMLFVAAGVWLGDDPLAEEFAWVKIPIMAQCRRWLDLSSALAGPEPEPRTGAVRHRAVSVGQAGPRITLMYGDDREEYEAEPPLLRRALALQAELWVMATTVRARGGDRLLALRTESGFEAWQAGVEGREFDPARLAAEERDVLEGLAAYDRERA